MLEKREASSRQITQRPGSQASTSCGTALLHWTFAFALPHSPRHLLAPFYFPSYPHCLNCLCLYLFSPTAKMTKTSPEQVLKRFAETERASDRLRLRLTNRINDSPSLLSSDRDQHTSEFEDIILQDYSGQKRTARLVLNAVRRCEDRLSGTSGHTTLSDEGYLQ